MPKAPMKQPYQSLAHDVIETLIASHKRWRPDLSYPESHSDMLGAVMGLLEMFEVKRRALPFRVPMHGDEEEEMRQRGESKVVVSGSGYRLEAIAKGVKVNDKNPKCVTVTIPRGRP
jgi:hypothetical protein